MVTSKEKAEFRGLFLGEGYATICKYKARYKHFHKKKKEWVIKDRVWYRPQLSVSQREDNGKMIYWIQQKFGGYVCRRTYFGKVGGNPALVWITINHELCKKLCKILLNSSIPSKKLNSVKIILEYLKIRYKKGDSRRYLGYSEEQNQAFEKLHLACKQNHQYSM